MKDDKGKVIFSLLAGATAGIMAGLLLAPETGEQARAGWRKSASKLGGTLRDLLQGGAPPTAAGHTNPDAAVSEDKASADRLLADLDANAGNNDFDYDGDGAAGRRHSLRQ